MRVVADRVNAHFWVSSGGLCGHGTGRIRQPMGHAERRGTARRRKTGIRRWETTETTTGVFKDV